MATITKIEEMEIWQMARTFAKEIGDIVELDSFAEEAGLKKQIKNSSGSIMDNIAEGFGRSSRNEFVNHLTIARGSAQETRSQLYRCHDLHLLNNDQFTHLMNQSEMLVKRITALINYLLKTPIKGPKFRGR
jgi:four helix bundle protein